MRNGMTSTAIRVGTTPNARHMPTDMAREHITVMTAVMPSPNCVSTNEERSDVHKYKEEKGSDVHKLKDEKGHLHIAA